MKTGVIKFGNTNVEFNLPDSADILTMASPQPLRDPKAAINEALQESIGSLGLDQIISAKLANNPGATAAVVISDSTRPVPYKGVNGILWPIIQKLYDNGFTSDRIKILVANGTHRPLNKSKLQNMVDPRVFEANISVINHDCKDLANLVYLGETSRGSRIMINRHYMEADLKILTGLVESHFMAGTSGGRKSICPGLVGEESTYVFHSPKMLVSPKACDLNLEGNPCHEEALEVARKAGVDYIINITLDHQFQLTGVFAGELEQAHHKAVQRLMEYITIPVTKDYDIVITHAGFVGINHYQSAKAGVGAIPLLKPGGVLIMAANNTEPNPIGSPKYQTVLHLLKLIGVEAFNKLILSESWTFIPEQWQVQMWAKVFTKISMDNFIYYSPQLSKGDYQFLPGIDGNNFLPEEERYQGNLQRISTFLEQALKQKINEIKSKTNQPLSIAFLADGPYGIPVLQK